MAAPQPLVSVMLLTMPGREKFRQIALDCYESQTYRHKELIMLGADYIAPIGKDRDHQDRIIWGKSSNSRPLGAKRNAAVAMANGDIIIHWDDDDWSAPDRITDQVGFLMTPGVQVTGYYTMHILDLCTGKWHHLGRGRSVNEPLGTSLCYYRDWALKHPFPEIQVGEDVEFARVASQHGVLYCEPSGRMMYATNHPGNTSPRTNMSRFPSVNPLGAFRDVPHLRFVNPAP